VPGKGRCVGREPVEGRHSRDEFIERALASRDEARRVGVYFSAESVHDELRVMLESSRERIYGLHRHAPRA